MSGCGRDADGGSGDGTYGGGGVYIWDRDGDIISWSKDNIVNITLETDTNTSLSYAPRL